MQTGDQAAEGNLGLMVCNASRTNMSIYTEGKNPHTQPVVSGVELAFWSQNAN
jgi:hypothetical protein